MNLWPDNLGENGGKVPAAILREQAERLKEKTQNIITGRIESSFLPRLIVMEKYGSDEDLFMYDFYLEAPVLDYYRHNLFTIFHGINLYPVILNTNEAIKKELSENIFNFTAQNEEEFLGLLKGIFNSKGTVTIINSLLSQAKVMMPGPFSD